MHREYRSPRFAASFVTSWRKNKTAFPEEGLRPGIGDRLEPGYQTFCLPIRLPHDRGGRRGAGENRACCPPAGALAASAWGLSIVNRLVEAHTGTIVSWNRPGGAAVFMIELPATDCLQLPDESSLA